MRRETGGRMRVALAVLLALGGGAAVSAQEPPPAERATERVTLEEVGNGWVVAPDFKFTQVDGGAGALLGAYGGKFLSRRLLVGGGAYWLSGAPDVGMAYGGGLVEWFANPGGRVDFSVRGFVGLGTATLSDPFGFDQRDCGLGDLDLDMFGPDTFFGSGRLGSGFDGGFPIGMTSPCVGGAFAFGAPGYDGDFEGDGDFDGNGDDFFEGANSWSVGSAGSPTLNSFGAFDGGLRQNFFIAEPTASVHVNLSSWLRITGGAGYRLIGYGGGFTDRLRGLTANIGVQITPR